MNRELIAFVPVLHEGYRALFQKYPSALHLVPPEFFSETLHLERDIRALPLSEMKRAIEALGIFRRIDILDEQKARALRKARAQFALPDEDVSHLFAKKFLRGKRVIYESVFLRWNKKISDTEYEMSPDRVISHSDFDREFIKRAEKDAEKSSDWGRQIGALLVKKGKILFTAHNRHLPSDYHLYAFGDPRSSFNAGDRTDVYTSIHAEATVVAEAARKGISVEGATLYITTFPCPNCARLVADAGIKKVCYSKGYSLRDAEMVFRARGVEIVLVK